MTVRNSGYKFVELSYILAGNQGSLIRPFLRFAH